MFRQRTEVAVMQTWGRGWVGTFIGLRYGDVPLFMGTPFLKSAEKPVLVFEIYAELWVPFEVFRIMGAIFGKYCKIIRREISY